VTQLISDYPVLPFTARADVPAPAPGRSGGLAFAPGSPRIGVVSNRRSHRNRGGRAPALPGGDLIAVMPETRAELTEALRDFRALGIDMLVVDGGDGTVRDVLTCGGAVWGDAWPRLAVLPSGKTNALAIDLGLPQDWGLADAVAAMRAGRTVVRRPIEVVRRDDATVPLRGFLLGAGAFAGATDLAQHTHRAGAFRGLAVGLALGWAVTQTLFGRDDGRWRGGTRMRLRFGTEARALAGGPVPNGDAARYLLLMTALGRFPLGLRPFGPPRQGMKTLIADAPPRRLAAALPAILGGAAPRWLPGAGYHRVDAATLDATLDDTFILDGEHFSGGALLIREGPPLAFAVP